MCRNPIRSIEISENPKCALEVILPILVRTGVPGGAVQELDAEFVFESDGRPGDLVGPSARFVENRESGSLVFVLCVQTARGAVVLHSKNRPQWVC
jgi:hypothetical protein